MYEFILSMWVAGKVSETRLSNYVKKGFVTEEEANIIRATPKLSDVE